jgi:hypothetical protein
MKNYMLKRSQITEALNQTLACLDRGETVDECLVRYPDLSDELLSLVETRLHLKALPPVQQLPSEVVGMHKRQFLAAASQYRRQAKSTTWLQRLSNRPLLEIKHPPLKTWPALAQVVLALVFTLCVAVGLYGTAQASAPDAPLYGLKMAIEDARLGLATDPSQHASLALTFAAERVREIVQTASRSQQAPESVLLRLQDQLRVALQDAASADEQNRQRILTEINDATEQLQNTLMRAESETPIATRAALREAEHLAAQARLQAEEDLNPSDPYQKGPNDIPVTPAPTFTQQVQPSATLHPTATELMPSASRTPAPDATKEPTQTPYRNRAGSEDEAIYTPAPQVTTPASSAAATPHQTGQPLSSPQQTAQPVETRHPAAQPTTAPSHRPEPGPAQEGSPKRTTFNLPTRSAG